MMPGSDDYESEPLVEVAVLEFKRERHPLRNEASLNFVSLRSPVDGVGSGALSMVEMNALRAPLTALPSREGKCLFDEADDFIDSGKIPLGRIAAAGCGGSDGGSSRGARRPKPPRLTGSITFGASEGRSGTTSE